MKAYIVVYDRPLKTKHGNVYIASNVLTSREHAEQLRSRGQSVVEFNWTPPWEALANS